MIQLHKILRSSFVVCPFCKSSIIESFPIAECDVCHTPHHMTCWRENGEHCSVFRCSGAHAMGVHLSGVEVARTELSRFGWSLAACWIINLVIPFSLQFFNQFAGIRYEFILLAEEGILIYFAWKALKKLILSLESPRILRTIWIVFLILVTIVFTTLNILYIGSQISKLQ